MLSNSSSFRFVKKKTDLPILIVIFVSSWLLFRYAACPDPNRELVVDNQSKFDVWLEADSLKYSQVIRAKSKVNLGYYRRHGGFCWKARLSDGSVFRDRCYVGKELYDHDDGRIVTITIEERFFGRIGQ